MAIDAFPPTDFANDFGLLALGGDLEVSSLLLAYRSGIFPWPIPGRKEIPWFSPPTRALLFFKEFNLNRSLRKELNAGRYTLSINSNFKSVIEHCASTPRQHEDSTWITKQMQDAYIAFHQAGYAHSVECYEGDTLVGGLYGVSVGGMFAGESMFHLKPNTSKLCIWHLIQHLEKQNVEWIDCQNITPFLESIGAVEVEREQFLNLLQKAVTRDICLFSTPEPNS